MGAAATQAHTPRPCPQAQPCLPRRRGEPSGRVRLTSENQLPPLTDQPWHRGSHMCSPPGPVPWGAGESCVQEQRGTAPRVGLAGSGKCRLPLPPPDARGSRGLGATAEGQWSSGVRSLSSSRRCTLAEGRPGPELLGGGRHPRGVVRGRRSPLGRRSQGAEVSPVLRPAHAPGPAF